MLSKLIRSRKNRRQNASTLRVDVQQLEFRVLLKAGALNTFSDPLVGSAAFPAAKGNVRIRPELGGATVSLTVAVENGPPGATVTVNLGGVAVGTIALAPVGAIGVAPGNGGLMLTGLAPIAAGTPITVTTAAGTVVVSGVLK